MELRRSKLNWISTVEGDLKAVDWHRKVVFLMKNDWVMQARITCNQAAVQCEYTL